MNDLQTISWDNTNIYKDFNDPQIEKDLALVAESTAIFESKEALYKNLINQLETNNTTDLYKNLELTIELYHRYLETNITYYQVMVYSMTALSVNTQNKEAKNLQARGQKLWTNYLKAFKPISICVQRSPTDFLTLFLDDKRTKELHFTLGRQREQNDHLLSTNEEVLLTGFALDGLSAWGKLYNEISGALKVNVDGETMALSSANNLYSNPDRTKREKAYRAINEGWRGQEISACAILNSINGWRNENYKVRSTKKELHYLDQTCHAANITRTTLDALMNTTFDKRAFGQEVLKTMARDLNVPQMGPWDLMAPYPAKTTASKISFPKAIEIIKAAFSEVDPSMADFAQMMADKKWIDCAPSENRAQGAYCTGYAKVRETRVFMTYDGSMKNVITLAHEIGHAYHNWVMKELPISECSYPMTLAETASIFAETVVRDYLLKTSESKDELKAILWQEIQSVQSLMINIPARYEFEKRFVEKRLEKNVTVEETKNIMVEAQKIWYGDTLSEYDEMFWASKLHFSMSERSFYNYPYLFGYLFSLGIYSKREALGKDFHARYVELLKDTGRMTAENLVKKHFNEDISKSDFWLRSIAIAEKAFEKYKSL